MSIFDRLKRLARAEINEMKRVLSDRDDEDPRAAAAREESERERLIREAEDELARAEGDVLAAEIEAGAALWGHPNAPLAPNAPNAPAWPAGHDAPNAPHGAGDIERGAALWGPEPGLFEVPGAPRPEGAGVADARPPEAARPPYESRTHAFPREVRDAYAVLEIPLGSDRAAVEAAFRDLLHRYHPDKHAGDPRRESVAHELTIRIREARDVLLDWLNDRKDP